MTHDVAFVGTGPEPDNPVWGESAAMAYRHGEGYRRLDSCDLVACADLVPENAEAFADEFGIDAVYEDYEEMLAEAAPDVVSVATPVPTHAAIVVDCLRHENAPDAVHCEKPMATTYADARLMEQEARRAGVQLTFNHQRRFGEEWREAKRLLDEGEIGDLERVEAGGKNLLDYGTHMIDLCNMFADEARAEWVLAQVDYREENVRYGAHNENQGLAQWEYANGVQGLALVGQGEFRRPWEHRIVGTDGVLEVGGDHGRLAVQREAGWETVDVPENDDQVAAAVAHLVECLETGEEPVVSATGALAATEIIFGAYESVRRRGRVEFPLRIDDNPLEDMVERGDLNPE
ncbi:MAG: Gfo/Idh/MocA family protein [Halobacteriaceae archaeon]